MSQVLLYSTYRQQVSIVLEVLQLNNLSPSYDIKYRLT